MRWDCRPPSNDKSETRGAPGRTCRPAAALIDNFNRMKTCPSCHRTYEDETLRFCLDDGAALLPATTAATDPNATLHLPTVRAAKPGPTVASPQSTLTSRPEHAAMSPQPFVSLDAGSPERTRRGTLPWLLGIAIVIGVSGIAIALILTRGRTNDNQQTALRSASPQTGEMNVESNRANSKTESAAATPKKTNDQQNKKKESPTPNSTSVTRATPSPTPYNSPKPRGNEGQDKPAFGPMMNNITFTGTNLTYYPRASPQLCQADCANNQGCRGFTWVKPGGYKAGDSPMCYLISYVSGKVSHPCCMSAVKNR